jgi:Xaa-Pro aminopeptidase
LRDNPLTQDGFVHSLGHGLGLRVHERPSFRLDSEGDERLDPGVVVTVEPGLYYPDRNLGVRLEDTVCVNLEGQIEVLAEYPLNLVLPMD